MRWVLLEHDWNGVHYDLLIETEEACITFAFEHDPFAHPGGTCERKAAHRKHYLEYEGPVSGGRGTVRRVRSGMLGRMQEVRDMLVAGLQSPDLMVLHFERRNGEEWAFTIEKFELD